MYQDCSSSSSSSSGSGLIRVPTAPAAATCDGDDLSISPTGLLLLHAGAAATASVGTRTDALSSSHHLHPVNTGVPASVPTTTTSTAPASRPTSAPVPALAIQTSSVSAPAPGFAATTLGGLAAATAAPFFPQPALHDQLIPTLPILSPFRHVHHDQHPSPSQQPQQHLHQQPHHRQQHQHQHLSPFVFPQPPRHQNPLPPPLSHPVRQPRFPPAHSLSPPSKQTTATSTSSRNLPVISHFKRSYQACLPCRSRKVKCDLGNPDAPNAPPCARCRREGKDCVFSGPRASTKKKHDATKEITTGSVRSRSTSDDEDGEGQDCASGVVSGCRVSGRQRKRSRGNNSYPLRRWDEETASYRRVDLISSSSPSPAIGRQQAQQLRRSRFDSEALNSGGTTVIGGVIEAAVSVTEDAGDAREQSSSDSGLPMGGGENCVEQDDGEDEEGEEDILVTTEMHSTHDAMDLLFQAAERVNRMSPILGLTSENGGSESASNPENRSQEDIGIVAGKSGSAACAVTGDSSPPEDGARSSDVSEPRGKSQSPTHIHHSCRPTSHAIRHDGNLDHSQGQHRPPISVRTSSLPDLRPYSGAIPASLNLPPPGATPWLFEVQPSLSPNPVEESLSRALQVWKTFKFCHLGWVTPLEAFTFINYFHTYMAPLSPILSGYFALPSAQQDLVNNEPLLVMTILTIAARYCPLGAASRGVYLHGRFWQFTQGLLERVIWGQDRGTGRKREKETKGLRGLGTVEALLLWTEWHPRGIHFPPMDIGGEEELMGAIGMGMGLTVGSSEGSNVGKGWDVSLVVPKTECSDASGDSDMNEGKEKEAVQDRWLEEVIEPTRRSDRLSWMLLGTALTLAHELGIFDTSPHGDLPPTSTVSSDTETARRIFRLRKLCYVYLHSLSTRLNWSSPLDNNRKLLNTITNQSETAYTFGPVVLSKYEQKWHRIMALYLDLTLMVRNATEMLFPSKRFTKELVRTGKYVGLVENFAQVLTTWEQGTKELNKYTGLPEEDQEKELEEHGVIIPKSFWNILRIEYCYARIFICCISLEAVGERKKRLHMHSKERGDEKETPETLQDSGIQEGTSPRNVFGDEGVDWDFIQMAFSSGQEILSIITAGGEVPASTITSENTTIPPACIPWLRFAPVRVYVRVIFAAIFLLKATALLLSLGPGIAPTPTRAVIIDQSRKCLNLLGRMVDALKRCAVDDVHLANTFAELLGMHIEVLTWRVHGKMLKERARRELSRGAVAGTLGSEGVIENMSGGGIPGHYPTQVTAKETSKQEQEKEMQVFSPTPQCVRDNHPGNQHDSLDGGEPIKMETNQHTPAVNKTFNAPTSSTISQGNSPSILSQRTAAPSPIIPTPFGAVTPGNTTTFPTPQRSTIWPFEDSPIDLSAPPSHPPPTFPPALNEATRELSVCEWGLPELDMDAVAMLSAGSVNGFDVDVTVNGLQNHIRGGGGPEELTGLGTYGMPGVMGEEEVVMDFLWDYSGG